MQVIQPRAAYALAPNSPQQLFSNPLWLSRAIPGNVKYTRMTTSPQQFNKEYACNMCGSLMETLFLSHVTSGARFGGAVSHRGEEGAGEEWSELECCSPEPLNGASRARHVIAPAVDRPRSYPAPALAAL